MQRRKYIIAAGASITIGLAGCMGSTGSPETVSEAWYEAVNDRDVSQARSLAHSEATEIDDDEFDELDELNYEVEVIDTEIIEENPDADEMANQFSDIDSTTAETIAENETAIVEVEIEEELELLGEEAEETSTPEFLTAEEDGEWRIVAQESDTECFITTATTQSVRTLESLRRYRDDWLTTTWLGELLVDIYYKISPPIANTLKKHPSSVPARVTRSLVEHCGSLSDRQQKTDSRVKSAAFGVMLLMLYIVGIVMGMVGHLLLQANKE